MYFLKQKDIVLDKFKLYESIVANKFGSKINTVRSDNGGEYKNAKMEEYLAEGGIIMENSSTHSSTKWQS